MKRLALIIVVFCGAIATYAQPSNVVSAWRYMKSNPPELDKAKEMIEPAILHEKTKTWSKTWYYRGLIYQAIGTDKKMKATEPNALRIAYDSYKESLRIEPKSDYADDISMQTKVLMLLFFNTALEQFNAKDFDGALKNFANVLDIDPNDTVAVLNAAISATRANNSVLTKEYYSKLIKMKYNDPKVYNSFANIYLQDKDTENYYNVVKQGRALFPSDKDLQTKELFYLISTNKTSQAIDGLNVALQKDPKNPTMLFALASIYDKMSYENGKKGDTVEFNKNFAKAEENYKKAIESKSDYFEANFNLGAMYFNLAAEMINKANDIDASKVKEYNLAKEKYDIKLKQAQPYLEKALEIQPKDDATLSSLRQLYAHLNMTDKSNEMKKRMDANK
jgi:Tfp pilus assembly protein PilF